MPLLRGACFSLVYLVAGVSSAVACDCFLPTTQEALHRAHAVFMGTIDQVTFLDPKDPGSRVIVKFKVARVWKGLVARDFEMRSIVETSMCEGFYRDDLVVGKKLLVFAHRSEMDSIKTYSTNICTLTGSVEIRRENIKELGAGVLPL